MPILGAKLFDMKQSTATFFLTRELLQLLKTEYEQHNLVL
jgi:hypothetical protein